MVDAFQRVLGPSEPGSPLTPGSREEERFQDWLCDLGPSEPGSPLTPGSREEERFQDWLCDLGLPRGLLRSPAVAKLKLKWAAELENEGLRDVLRKVKDRELEMAAAEAADLYQAFEIECQELAQRNESLTSEAAGFGQT